MPALAAGQARIDQYAVSRRDSCDLTPHLDDISCNISSQDMGTRKPKSGAPDAGARVQVKPIESAGPYPDLDVVGPCDRLGQVPVGQDFDSAVLGDVDCFQFLCPLILALSVIPAHRVFEKTPQCLEVGISARHVRVVMSRTLDRIEALRLIGGTEQVPG